MGQDRVTSESDSLRAGRSGGLKRFDVAHASICSLGRRSGPGDRPPHLGDAWGREHRPDWAARGLLIWPRGRGWIRLEQDLQWPKSWSRSPESRGRLALSWWAERMRLWVDGELVHEGDLFDTACRWIVPDRCREGAPLQLLLELSSPLHDDGALISSCLNLEPRCEASDPDRALLPEALELHLAAGGGLPVQWQQLDPLSPQALEAVEAHLARAEPAPGSLHWLGHAHLDLAWLWPVADTWQAAERTFRSALQLLQRWPELHFAHSTPALYEWLERHRPALFAGVRAASRAGRWEPVNGPWVGIGLRPGQQCVALATVRCRAGLQPSRFPGVGAPLGLVAGQLRFLRWSAGRGPSQWSAVVLHPQARLERDESLPPSFVSLAWAGRLRTAESDAASDRPSRRSTRLACGAARLATANRSGPGALDPRRGGPRRWPTGRNA